MLQRIHYHRWRGARKNCYGCVGDTLYKPKVITADTLDIRDEHFAFLRGKRPTTSQEKRIHALLIHENTHSERQLALGVWWFQLLYIFSRSFRLKEEKAAYGAEIEQLVRYQFRVRAAQVAESMSGPIYRHAFRNMVRYDESLAWVRKTIRKAEITFFSECMNLEDESGEPSELPESADSPQKTAGTARPISVVKDRIALVCTAMTTFIVIELVVFVIVFVSGTFNGKH